MRPGRRAGRPATGSARPGGRSRPRAGAGSRPSRAPGEAYNPGRSRQAAPSGTGRSTGTALRFGSGRPPHPPPPGHCLIAGRRPNRRRKVRVALRLVPLACLVAGWLVPGTATATLVSEDSSFGTDTITFDTETGLRWLDLTLSNGLSHDEVLQALLPGGQFEGYRLPRSARLAPLFLHAGCAFDPAAPGD